MAVLDVTTRDARTLEVLTGGDPDGLPLLFHSGSPSAAVQDPSLERVTRELGLRLVTYSRPGYGGSTPYPEPVGARVIDDIDDVRTILDHLGVGEFLTIGHSGGGPRALATAALMPDRCLAATTLAGVAPFGADDLDWFAGMADENVAEYTAARQGVDAYGAFLEKELTPAFSVTADEIAAAFGGLVTPVDRAALTGEYAEVMAQVFHRAGAQGVVGARDDGLAVTSPWGFDLGDVRVPVAVWQGRQDAMVPYAHGQWLAAHVPGAEAHLLDEEGHLSLVAQMDVILRDLIRLAGR